MSIFALDLINKCFDTQVPYLDLGRCGLSDDDFTEGSPLDIALSKCTHLQELVLSNEWDDFWGRNESRNNAGENVFTVPPPVLAKLRELNLLIYAGNYDNEWGITDMGFVQHLVKLSSLNLSNNKILKLKGLEKLHLLRRFDISHNKICKLEGLESLTSLQEFYINGNHISKLEGIENLSSLQRFNISGNQINKLEGLAKLTSLQGFDISKNQINKLQGLAELLSLQYFDIRSNQIRKLEGLENLSSLRYFYISSNRISKVEGLENLSSLQALNLSTNQITDIGPLLVFLQNRGTLLKIVTTESFTGVGEINVGKNPTEHATIGNSWAGS